MRSSTSVISVTLVDNEQRPSTPVTSVVPSLSSRRNTTRGYRWVTRLLPLWTSVARDPKEELRGRQQVEPRGLLLDISPEVTRQIRVRGPLAVYARYRTCSS